MCVCRVIFVFLILSFSTFVVSAEPEKNDVDSILAEEAADGTIATRVDTNPAVNTSGDAVEYEEQTIRNEEEKTSSTEALALEPIPEKNEEAATEDREASENEDADTVAEAEESEGQSLDQADDNEIHEHHEHDEYAHEHLLPSKLRRSPPFAVQIDVGDSEEGVPQPPEYDLDFPPTITTNGVFAMCYTLNLEDIMKRCKGARRWGTGVYIPAFNRTGEKINDEGVTKSSYALFDPIWYETIQQFKTETNLTVYGLIFEMDNLTEMFNELVQFTDVFDGFFIDWEYQPHACYTKVPKLNTTKEIRYFVGNQDRSECDTTFDDFVNTPDRKSVPIPPHITPVFSCFDGNEGRCYRSFVTFRNVTCDSTKQRYSFNPWGPATTWFLFRDSCGSKLPPHDFIQSL